MIYQGIKAKREFRSRFCEYFITYKSRETRLPDL